MEGLFSSPTPLAGPLSITSLQRLCSTLFSREEGMRSRLDTLEAELARSRKYAADLHVALTQQVANAMELEAALATDEAARATTEAARVDELQCAALQMHMMLYTSPPSPPPPREFGPPSPPPPTWLAATAALEARAVTAEKEAARLHSLLADSLAQQAATRDRVAAEKATLYKEHAAELAALKKSHI